MHAQDTHLIIERVPRTSVEAASRFATTMVVSPKDRGIANLIIVAFFFVSLVLPSAVRLSSNYEPLRKYDDDLRRKICNPLRASTGIIALWNLFGPDVRDKNVHYSSVITFADGSTKLYEFPRSQKMGYFERFQKEKQRKLFIDCLPQVFTRPMLPSVARFLFDANADPTNPPRKVVFTQHWIDTPPPGSGVKRDNLPEHTAFQSFFQYDGIVDRVPKPAK